MLKLSDGPHHIAVFKPANICVVGGKKVPKPTLLDLMRKAHGPNIFPVHRLDRGTSGITLFAKSQFAKMAIENAFKKRLVKKTYWAVVEGQPDFKKIIVENRLKKQGDLQTICDLGDFSQTNFKFIKNIGENYALIEAKPISGRMHQIRVHLMSLGFPIVGDLIYGAKTKINTPHTIALCAVGLEFPGPKGGKITIDAKGYFDESKFLRDVRI